MPVNRETCPAGLLATADLAERIPERAGDLFRFERHRRELESLQIHEDRKKLSWHPWSTIRLLVASGAAAFAIAWGFGILADFMKLYEQTVSKANAIPSAITGITIPSLNTILPVGTSALFASIPRVGVKESMIIAIGIVLAIALIKLAIILFNWKKIALLNEAEKRITDEMKTLDEWIGEAEQSKKTS